MAWLAAYGALNIGYNAYFKGKAGLQQAAIAVGFWLRLLGGSEPAIQVHLTPWATLYTLGLAYYLNCLKSVQKDKSPQERLADGLGAGLSGALSLVALCGVCLARYEAGTLRVPELPPLFTLMAMHRAAALSNHASTRREQASSFFTDLPTLIAMAAFVLSFLWD